jgi:hypothetical protein
VKQLAGFPYAELAFDKHAAPVDRSGFDELRAAAASGDPSDVIVISHGWNNDMDEARALYEGVAGQLRDALAGGTPSGLKDRRFAILGVLWPSKKFAERSLVPGGAASAGGGQDSALQERLDELKGAFDAGDADERLERAKGLAGDLDDSPAARDKFVDAVRGVLSTGATGDGDDYSDEYHKLAGRDVLDLLKEPVFDDVPTGGGGAAGGAASTRGPDTDDGGAAWGLSVAGIKAAAERFLNLTTYYQMKQRAGLIGTSGLQPCLRELRADAPGVRLHLVGHSFGGRLVTATTAGEPGGPALEPDTVTLLQAAFSHFGFAHDYEPGKDGFFRRMLADRLSRGPVLVTHSVHDTAVGYAYPLASRLAGFAAAGLGDATDRFGGIGRNGAQKTPEAVDGTLQPAGTPYTFESGHVYNLRADDVIHNHSDIRGPEVAHAILSSIAS